jgi:hypothetical protein
LFGVLGAVGCKGEDVNVNVDCKTTATPSFVCEVTETKGKSEVDVCWDVSATCANDAVVSAPKTCVKVKDGGKVTETITELTGFDKCAGDHPPTMTLANLTINGKASTGK